MYCIPFRSAFRHFMFGFALSFSPFLGVFHFSPLTFPLLYILFGSLGTLHVTRHKSRKEVGLFHGSLAVGPRAEQ
jgi:hypothetical protein